MHGTNPKDPLPKACPPSEYELFKRFAREADGFSTQDAVGAASNVLVNGLRQAHATRGQAEARFDELFGKLKTVLLDHYDSLGNRRSVFPFHQFIRPNLFIDDEKLKKN